MAADEREIQNSRVPRTTTTFSNPQREDDWVHPLKTDAAMTAQYLLRNHYGETPSALLEQKLACYLRHTQLPGGGWTFYPGGPMAVTPSVQAYFALKVAGDPQNAPHMIRARDAIRAAGGAEVFSRILYELLGVLTQGGGGLAEGVRERQELER